MDPSGTFVGHALVQSPVFSAKITVIGCEHDDRVVDEIMLAQRFQNLADIVIDTLHHPIVLPH